MTMHSLFVGDTAELEPDLMDAMSGAERSCAVNLSIAGSMTEAHSMLSPELHLVVCQNEIPAAGGVQAKSPRNTADVVNRVISEFNDTFVFVIDGGANPFLADVHQADIFDADGCVDAVEWVYDAVQHWDGLDKAVKDAWIEAAREGAVLAGAGSSVQAIAMDAALRGHEDADVSRHGADIIRGKAGRYVRSVISESGLS